MGWREQKRAAKDIVHDTMHYPALYLPTFPLPTDVEPTACTVRIHTKWGALGDQKGVSFDYATREDVQPKIIFRLSEVTPARKGIVSVAAGEAYRIDVLEEPDDQYQTAVVVRMPTDQTTDLPLPEA